MVVQYSPLKARSVPFSRSTRNRRGELGLQNSSSLFRADISFVPGLRVAARR
jgi:hypothetical protein